MFQPCYFLTLKIKTFPEAKEDGPPEPDPADYRGQQQEQQQDQHQDEVHQHWDAQKWEGGHQDQWRRRDQNSSDKQ